MIRAHLGWINLLKAKLNKKNKALKLYKNNKMGNNFCNLYNLLQDFSELTKTEKNKQ